ncbi:MAG: helix-turn-helix transcriptional regulator, partial [Eubacteriaceae bacterium]|nr:helix-turn-helix transcriptional regulator [Eubacteriaceae bacterium]
MKKTDELIHFWCFVDKITRRLNALGFTDVVDGTVYNILVRLEKKKLVDIEKKPSDMGPPRKFYVLND